MTNILQPQVYKMLGDPSIPDSSHIQQQEIRLFSSIKTGQSKLMSLPGGLSVTDDWLTAWDIVWESDTTVLI